MKHPKCPGFGKCPYASKVRHDSYELTICGGQCGRVRNCAHPLAPCAKCPREYDSEGYELDPEDVAHGYDGELHYCEVDEYSIERGNRCWRYIAWLDAMRLREEGKL